MKDSERRVVGKNWHNQLFELAGIGTATSYLHRAMLSLGNKQFFLLDDKLNKDKIDERFHLIHDIQVIKGNVPEVTLKVIYDKMLEDRDQIFGTFYDLTHSLAHIATDTFHTPKEELRRSAADLGLFGFDTSLFGCMHMINWVITTKEENGLYYKYPEKLKETLKSLNKVFKEYKDADGLPSKAAIETGLDIANGRVLEYGYYTQEIIESGKMVFDGVPLIKKDASENEFAITPENYLEAFVRGQFAKEKIIQYSSTYKPRENIEGIFSLDYKQNINGKVCYTVDLQKHLYVMASNPIYADDTERELALRIAQDKAVPNQRLPFTAIQIKNFKEAGADMREKLTKIYSL